MDLYNFVTENTVRGDCQCGKCIDAPGNALGPDRESQQPDGHTADLIFFKVSAVGEPDAEELRRLIKDHKGDYGEVDLFDGAEHGYMEIGAWIGDQGVAMMLMGLGSLLGLWRLLTPRTVLGALIDEDRVQQMAGMGMINIQATSGEEVTNV